MERLPQGLERGNSCEAAWNDRFQTYQAPVRADDGLDLTESGRWSKRVPATPMRDPVPRRPVRRSDRVASLGQHRL